MLSLLFTASLKALSGKVFAIRLIVNNLNLMIISNGRIRFVRSGYQCFCWNKEITVKVRLANKSNNFFRGDLEATKN